MAQQVQPREKPVFFAYAYTNCRMANEVSPHHSKLPKQPVDESVALPTETESPPPPAGSCSECGNTELLTHVELSSPTSEDACTPPPVRQALLCPACLSDSLSDWRREGGIIEARLRGGRVARWYGPTLE